jgi:O-antigen/teichoic acid export membrane protein
VNRVVDWFRDGAMRRVARYGAAVVLGRGLSSLASLVTMALLTRQLGPELFGVLALIRTVTTITEAYANFNTWQAIIKYGSEAVAIGRRDDVKRIIKLAVLIDVITAAIAAAVIAALAFVVPSAFGWSDKEALLCALYAITVLTRVAGASDGVFRICDAYRVQAFATIAGAIAPAIATIIAVVLDSSLGGCIIALIVGETIGNAVVMITSFWVAAAHGFGGWMKTSLVGVTEAFPGIRHFMLATNAQLTVKKTQTELDMVVVGAMVGTYASGLFKVVKQLGSLPGRVFMPFEQVLFTELSRLQATGSLASFARVLRRFAVTALLGSLVLWAISAVLADPVIRLVAGPKFVEAVPAFRIYLLAMVLSVANAPQQRALVALGRPGTLFVFDLATLAVLFATVISGAYMWGLVGASVAILIHKALQLTWSSWLVARVIRELRGPPR